MSREHFVLRGKGADCPLSSVCRTEEASDSRGRWWRAGGCTSLRPRPSSASGSRGPSAPAAHGAPRLPGAPPAGPAALWPPSAAARPGPLVAAGGGTGGIRSGTDRPTPALKRDFREMRPHLEEKKYSDCAWEVVRAAIRGSLSSSAHVQIG